MNCVHDDAFRRRCPSTSSASYRERTASPRGVEMIHTACMGCN